ncbi:MAG: hypothetical protein SP1CHLAM54_15580 [Chlamydiia bacterium]|nr:hypothetical protein [Chlamydiia bacterium]MCH9616448.1 hypothetical protein [Chlamydiia bacterium]MCH9629566.1 hypothetical protein [Chlamydiia bacterium]
MSAIGGTGHTGGIGNPMGDSNKLPMEEQANKTGESMEAYEKNPTVAAYNQACVDTCKTYKLLAQITPPDTKAYATFAQACNQLGGIAVPGSEHSSAMMMKAGAAMLDLASAEPCAPISDGSLAGINSLNDIFTSKNYFQLEAFSVDGNNNSYSAMPGFIQTLGAASYAQSQGWTDQSDAFSTAALNAATGLSQATLIQSGPLEGAIANPENYNSAIAELKDSMGQ